MKGHKLEVVSTRPGTHLVSCQCGTLIKATDGRVHKHHWSSYERAKYRAAYQRHLAEVAP